MADERIYITEVKEGDVCPFEEKCEGFYKLCEGCNVLPTRQEVIYKMAKALCNMYYSACSECAFKDKPKDCKSLLKNSDFYEQAEAALDALLSQGE